MSKKMIYILACFAQLLFMPSAYTETIQNVEAVDCNTSPWLNPGLLNSTRIELKFGSYGVKVLAQDLNSGTRLSSLYSGDAKESIARTLALTCYEAKIDDKLKAAHEEILSGGSIGLTLKKYGFTIEKNLFFKGKVEDMSVAAQQLMHVQESICAAIIYDLVAIEENESYPYCTILEVYSPEFLNLEEVQTIYSEFNKTLLNDEETTKAIHMINQMELLLL